MITRTIGFLFSFSLLTAPLLSAEVRHKPRIKALLIADTSTENLRIGTTLDIERVQKALQSIAHRLHFKTQITLLENNSVSEKTINRWFLEEQKSPSAVSFIYYTGHGTRNKGTKKAGGDLFPIFVLPKTHNRLLGISNALLIKKLSYLPSRLRICISDCCNNTGGKRKILHAKALVSKNLFPERAKLPGLKSLFQRQTGIICAIAASPGEAAITALNGKNPGSFFTTSFFSSLAKQAEKKDPSWTEVCQGSTIFIKDRLHSPQNPFYMIALKTKGTEEVSPIFIFNPLAAKPHAR